MSTRSVFQQPATEPSRDMYLVRERPCGGAKPDTSAVGVLVISECARRVGLPYRPTVLLVYAQNKIIKEREGENSVLGVL